MSTERTDKGSGPSPGHREMGVMGTLSALVTAFLGLASGFLSNTVLRGLHAWPHPACSRHPAPTRGLISPAGLDTVQPGCCASALLDALESSLEDQDVRDLCWAVSSASVLRPEASPHGASLQLLEDEEARAVLCCNTEQALDFLRQAQADSHHLRQWLQGKRHRLGKHFEALIEYWLRFAPVSMPGRVPPAVSSCPGPLQVPTSSPPHIRVRTQIHKDRRTVGECDFVLPETHPATQEGGGVSAGGGGVRWWHIETSIKFFLCIEGVGSAGGTMGGFLGPHRKESMADRVQCAARQLQLCQAEGGFRVEALEALEIPPGDATETVVLARYLSRGWLFYPVMCACGVVHSRSYCPPQLARQGSERSGWWAHELPDFECGGQDVGGDREGPGCDRDTLWLAAFRNAQWPLAPVALAVEEHQLASLAGNGGGGECAAADSETDSATPALVPDAADAPPKPKPLLYETGILHEVLRRHFAPSRECSRPELQRKPPAPVLVVALRCGECGRANGYFRCVRACGWRTLCEDATLSS